MFEKIICTLFRISTLTFLLGGLTIVTGQAIGIIVGNGHFVTSFEEALAPWAYGAAGIAGLLSFVLMYFHREAHYTGDEHDEEDAVARHAAEPAR
jgi:hypothetical protein